jgi:hypothetical protein
MKTILFLIFFLCTFHLQAQNFSQDTCAKQNIASIKECLIKTFGNDWHNTFCENKGKFFFTAQVDTTGAIIEIRQYKIKNGMSDKEFIMFAQEIRKYKLCVPNQNPEMTAKDFEKLLQEGKLPYTFMYQGIKQCND